MGKYDSPEFKALYKEWVSGTKAKYRKVVQADGTIKKVLVSPAIPSILECTGFNDIEDTHRDDKPLKTWDDSTFRNIPADKRLVKEAYYEHARDLLNTYKFQNSTHRVIWEMHSEGRSCRHIANHIKGLNPTYKKSMVINIVNMIGREIKGVPDANRNEKVQP